MYLLKNLLLYRRSAHRPTDDLDRNNTTHQCSGESEKTNAFDLMVHSSASSGAHAAYPASDSRTTSIAQAFREWFKFGLYSKNYPATKTNDHLDVKSAIDIMMQFKKAEEVVPALGKFAVACKSLSALGARLQVA